MNIKELDGYLAALVVGPDLVMPSEYLPLLWGDDPEAGPEYQSLEEANTILLLIMRHWNTIAAAVEKNERYLPVVLTRDEVRAVLGHMEGEPRLMATLLYGCGLRLLECCRLRVKDLDFGRNQITVRRGKGDKDRATMLPVSIKSELAVHLERVRAQHERDLVSGAGWVELPGALAKKLPSAGQEWPWQWVFPATRTYVERETGEKRRHHLHETVVQHAVRRAVLAAGIPKRATCHTFRHSFATHLLKAGSDIRTVMIYTHVLNRGPAGVQSPADRLLGG